MLKHSRKMVLLVALCWVVPASAEQQPNGSAGDCPYAEEAQLVVIAGDDGFGEVPVDTRRRAFFP
jgi:hypothetical protein